MRAQRGVETALVVRYLGRMRNIAFPLHSLTLFASLTLMACSPDPMDGASDADTSTDTTEDSSGSDEIGLTETSVPDTDTETDESTESGDSTETSDIGCQGVFAEMTCEGDACEARWAGTEAWSIVVGSETIDSWVVVPTSGLFTCGSSIPDVDGCGKIDGQGHIACWVWEGSCARLAVPLCEVAATAEFTEYWPAWMSCKAGEPIGVPALCSDQFCWMELDPTSSIHPSC
jgi:hypothetical protein